MDEMETMKRGRSEVVHAQLYADSILHPHSIRDVIQAYFRTKGRAIERKIKFLSHAHGQLNVYYIQPEGMCHFEIFPRFTTDTVLEPMDLHNARGGKTFDHWDVAFMANYYKSFDFRPMGNEERSATADYFKSEAWERLYAVMYYDNERAVHCYAIVNTSLHPEDILPIGQAAIEARGWDVDRAVSVVFGVNGYDQGKITYLVREPEIVLELEWIHNRDKTIEPAVVPVARITTTDMVDRDMVGLPYIKLDRDDISWLESRFAKQAA